MAQWSLGWNTWDYRSFNIFSFLEDDGLSLSLRVGVFDVQRGIYHREFRWPDCKVLGPHATDGACTSVEFEAGFEASFRTESARKGKTLFLRILPVRTSVKRVVVELERPGVSRFQRSGSDLYFGNWKARAFGAESGSSCFLQLDIPYFLGKPGSPLRIVCTQEDLPDEGAVDREIDRALRRYGEECFQGSGILGEGPQAMIRGIAWNTLYDRGNVGIATTVSRDWCRDWRGVTVFCWDSFFHALMASFESPELAYRNFETTLRCATSKGFVPNYASSSGGSSLDRSQPPVGAYLLWKVYQAFPARKVLSRLFPGLLHWHRWWRRERDGNRDGLLEWGSNAEPQYENFNLKQVSQNEHICACWESGLDNSPLFDSVPFNKERGVLEMSDVGLNSLYAASAEALCAMAEELGKRREAEELKKDYMEMKERINSLLWCKERGIYLNRKWDGDFCQVLTPCSFYPMLAAIPDSKRAERMVKEHLLNEGEFWGEYGLPSVSRSDPAFLDNDYWRGRIWPPMNFLVCEGLRRYCFDSAAWDLAQRGLKTFLMNWKGRGIYENYNSVTGQGPDVWNAHSVYSWGGLLPLIAVQELIDMEPYRGWRFGNLTGKPSSVKNLTARKGPYEVRLSEDGLQVLRKNALILSTDAPACIRGFREEKGGIFFSLESEETVRLRLFGLAPGTPCLIETKRGAVRKKANAKGTVSLALYRPLSSK